jgi:tRNA pseudouridine55 synthase
MDLGDAYCESLRRTAIGDFDVADAGEELIPLDAALGFMPEVELRGEDAKKASHGVAVPGTAAEVVRLVDEAGLVCLAEPREGGVLKPIVGFRG